MAGREREEFFLITISILEFRADFRPVRNRRSPHLLTRRPGTGVTAGSPVRSGSIDAFPSAVWRARDNPLFCGPNSPCCRRVGRKSNAGAGWRELRSGSAVLRQVIRPGRLLAMRRRPGELCYGPCIRAMFCTCWDSAAMPVASAARAEGWSASVRPPGQRPVTGSSRRRRRRRSG